MFAAFFIVSALPNSAHSQTSYAGPATCNAAYEAVMWYNADENVMQYCNGEDWVATGVEYSSGGGGGGATPVEGYGVIASGGSYTCALKTDGSIACWGQNTDGKSTPPAGTDFETISAGATHSCAVKTDGSLACWGRNVEGQSTPPAGTDYTMVASGSAHSCAVKTDGSLACWGSDTSGQSTPPAGTDYQAVTAGSDLSCALKTDGSLACWGLNVFGQATPPAGTDYTMVSAGAYHACAVKTDGSLACWGNNDDGQSSPPAGTDFQDISGAAWTTCALKTDNSITCWGNNLYSQVSNAPAGTDFTALATGSLHSCALKTDGSVTCWGHNNDGQSTPPGGTDFAQPNIGGDGTCANPDGVAGEIDYNLDEGIMQYCNGSYWVAMGAKITGVGVTTNCAAAGETCNDGTIYAGSTPDGSIPMYISAAAHEASATTWNDGSAQDGATAVTDMDDGNGNTEALVATSDGFDPYAAAAYCDTLSAHGYNDWYLPAANEALLFYDTGTEIGDVNGAATYWTSTSESTADAYALVPGGTVSATAKDAPHNVRCVRASNNPPLSRCSTPPGTPGEIVYNNDHRIMQYCNGEQWVAMAPERGIPAFTPSSPGAFVVVYNTTLDDDGTSDTELMIKTHAGSTYNYDIAWQDSLGNTGSATGLTGDHTLTGLAPGEVTVEITGTFPHFQGDNVNHGVVDVAQWGDQVWASMVSAFREEDALTTFSATDAPDLSAVTDMGTIFTNASNFNGDISGWDISNVTSLSHAFYNATSFNQDISGWNTENVYSFMRIFFGATSFNQDISGWDTSGVITMEYAFSGASAFNQDISNWNTENVWYMDYMFQNASAFNQDLSGWCVTKIGSTPPDFDTGATSWTGGAATRPQWGTCVSQTPDAFSFTDQTGIALSTQVESNIVQITGLGTDVTAAISGGGAEYRICSDAACSSEVQTWTTSNTSISNGEYLQLRLTSSASYSTMASTNISVGVSSDQWDVTTLAQDTTPDAFSFTDQTGVALSTQITSNSVNINGITGSVSVSVSGDGSPEIRIAGGSWVTSGTITNGQSLEVRLNSNASNNTMNSATVAVGTGSDQWDVTTTDAVAYWPMDEMSGASASDISENGNDMSLTNTSWVTGKVGAGALELNNSSTRVKLNPSSALDGLRPLSVCAWVYARAFATDGSYDSRIVSKYFNGSNEAWTFTLDGHGGTDRTMGFYHMSTTSLTYHLGVAGPDDWLAGDLNSWVHLCATWDGTGSASGVKLFKNATEAPSYVVFYQNNGTIHPDGNGEVTIGGFADSGAGWLDGRVDDVRIYDRVLSPAEITNIYNLAP